MTITLNAQKPLSQYEQRLGRPKVFDNHMMHLMVLRIYHKDLDRFVINLNNMVTLVGRNFERHWLI